MSDSTHSPDPLPPEEARPSSQASAAQLPTTDQEGPTRQAVAKTSWLSKICTALADIFKAVIPERVAFLGDKYGPALFVGFILGGITGIIFFTGLLVNSEWLRTTMLPAPQFAREPSPDEKRERLSSIKFSKTDSPPDFLLDYENLLGKFGESEKSGIIANSPVGVVDHVFTKAVHKFAFTVRPRFGNSEIDARVFRQMTIGDSARPRDVYEPIVAREGSSQNGFSYYVEECNANDKLIMVLLIIPRKPGISKFTDYFEVSLIE